MSDSLKLENQLCFPLYACAREVIKKYRPYLDAIGLTYTQYIVMLVLWEYSEVTVRKLCRLLYLDSGTLTPVLKSLESKGLLSRQRSHEDERVLIVQITEIGSALREKAEYIPGQIGRCICLSVEEAALLHKLLYKILEHKHDEN